MMALAVRVAAVAMLATMMALVKLVAARGVSFVEIMFWRQFITVPLIIGFLMMTGALHRLKTARVSHHFRRAFLGLAGMAMKHGSEGFFAFDDPLEAALVSALVELARGAD